MKFKALALPGEERELENIYNNPNNVVIDVMKVACPKEALILVYVQWEDHSDE